MLDIVGVGVVVGDSCVWICCGTGVCWMVWGVSALG